MTESPEKLQKGRVGVTQTPLIDTILPGETREQKVNETYKLVCRRATRFLIIILAFLIT